MLAEDESDRPLEKIDEECTNQSEEQPTDSLTGLEEALEELRRYEDGSEETHQPNATQMGSQIDQYRPIPSLPIHQDPASDAGGSTSSANQVAESQNVPAGPGAPPVVSDPLTAYLNPVTTITSSLTSSHMHPTSVFTLGPTATESEPPPEPGGPMLTTLTPGMVDFSQNRACHTHTLQSLQKGEQLKKT